MRYSPRFWMSVCSIATLLLILAWKPMAAAQGQVVIVVGGDVEWALNSRPPTVRYHVVDPKPYGLLVFGKRDVRDQVTGDWPPIPFVNECESKAYLEGLGLKGGRNDSSGEELSYPLPQQTRPEYNQDYSSNEELLNHPLKRLTPTFHAADLVFVNCEGALSDLGRQVGLNRTPEKFGTAMKSSGISIVNLANNHTFDAEERGFLDTLRVLDAAGIAHVGGGHDLAEARKPVILERHRLLPDVPSFAELGYPRMDISLWYGIVAPATTPQPIVQRLNAELVKILNMPDIRRSFADQGADIQGGTPAWFETFMREESARWGAVINQAGIKPE